MISLHVEDVAAVELSQLSAALRPGETLALTAEVVPDYADDLSIEWISSDPAVCAVDKAGLATAVAPCACEIIARGAGGVEDRCAVTVE